MGSKHRVARNEQKFYWENRLSQRLALLTEKGLEPASIAKDPGVRKIRAQIRETAARLSAIDALENKTAQMAKAKAEKASASKKETDKRKKRTPEEAPEESKRQQKKKKKLEKKKENKTDA